MDHTAIRQRLVTFDQVVGQLSIRIPEEAPINRALATTREFLDDDLRMSDDEITAKWSLRYDEFRDARFAVERFVGVVLDLHDLPRFKSNVGKVIAGSIVQDFTATTEKDILAKDTMYELEMAADLRNAGFTVKLAEPDVVVEGNGLSQPLGLACKYPSSRKGLHGHLSKGYNQLKGQNLDGVVAIGLDLIVAAEKGLKPGLDFRIGRESPMEVLQPHLAEEVDVLEKERPDYIDEPQLKGLLLTLSLGGIYGSPPRYVILNAITARCAEGEPLGADLAVIQEEIEGLNSAIA